MDYSKFKKIHMDQNITKLQHPDGHEITVAHRALTPKMRDQLNKVPMHFDEGGTIPSALSPVSQQQDMVSPLVTPDINATAQDFAALPNAKPNRTPYEESLLSLKQEFPNVAEESLSKRAIDLAKQNLEKQKAAEVPKEQGANFLSSIQDKMQVGAPLSDQEKQFIAQSSQQKQAPEGMPQVPVNPDPYGFGLYGDTYSKGLGMQMQGLMGEAAAQGKLGRAQSGIEEASAQKIQEANDQAQKQIAPLFEQQEALAQDLRNGHVDPKRFLNSMSGGDKIMTAVGLFLGGLGGGLLGNGKNVALDFLNNQIDRDVRAQETEIGKKRTLLEDNMRRIGNIKDAAQMTKSNILDITAAHLRSEAAKIQDPMARARALQGVGELEKQSAQIVSQIAMKKAMLGPQANGQVDPGMKIKAIVPEGQQNEYFKELEDAQKTSKTKSNILSAFDQLNNINTVGNRVMSPLQSDKQVDAIVKPILASLSKETAGRFTEADAGFLEAVFPRPGDSQQTIETKRRKLNALLTEKMNFPRLKSIGIDSSGMGKYNEGGQQRFQLGKPVVK